MKTKGKILRRVWRIFKPSGSVDCQANQIYTNAFFACDTLNHCDAYPESNLTSIKIQKKAELGATFIQRRFPLYKPKKCGPISPARSQAELRYEVDLNDDSVGLRDFLAFRQITCGRSSNYPASTPGTCGTGFLSPETKVDLPLETGPVMDIGDDIPPFQYTVATSKIPLEILFKQMHFKTNKALWNSLLVPCDTSRSQDSSFDVQIIVPLPSRNFASVDQAMQVGVFFCHRSRITSQSSYFRTLMRCHPGEDRRDSSTSIDIVTFTSPPFSVETFTIVMNFIYKISEKHLLRSDFQSASGVLNCSEPFLLYKAAKVLGLSVLVKRVSSELIVEKMLHRNSSDILTDSTEHSQLLRSNWTCPNDQAVCRCSNCAHDAPRVLLFSLEDDVNDFFLERAARQTLMESFGMGWCTNEFTSLPHDTMESISEGLLAVITPRNSLSLLFASEEALSALERSPLQSFSTRMLIAITRTAIENLIAEDPGACFSSPEWAEMSNSLNLQTETGPDHAVKLRWISDSINRITQNMDLCAENSDYLDRLRHWVAELRLTSTYQPYTPSSHVSEDRVFQFVHSPVVSSTYRQSQSSSVINSIASKASPAATRLTSRSIYSTTQGSGSVDSLPYSHASSRTASTDYGLFYTRLGLSPPPSLHETPITPPRALMTPHVPQPRIYRRSLLGIFSSNSPKNFVVSDVTPYTLSPRPSPRIDSPPRTRSSSKSGFVSSYSPSNSPNNFVVSDVTPYPLSFRPSPRIDSPPRARSSLKSGFVSSYSPSLAPSMDPELPPAYALVERREDSSHHLREYERRVVESNNAVPVLNTAPAMSNTQAEDQASLQQRILELQSTNARLQDALVKHGAVLQDAINRMNVYQHQERTNVISREEHAQDVDINQNKSLPINNSASHQSATEVTEDKYIQEDVLLPGPSESPVNTIDECSRNPGEQEAKQRVNHIEVAQSKTLENTKTFNVQQDAMEVRILFKPQTHSVRYRRSSSQSSSATTLNEIPEEVEEIEGMENEMVEKDNRYPDIPVQKGTGNHAGAHSAKLSSVKDDRHVDQPFSENQEEGIAKEFYQLDEYLAQFEERLTLYKSACEERLVSRPKGKGSAACGSSRQEVLHQKELVDKLDNVIWKFQEGRKNLAEVCLKIRDDYASSRRQERTENPWQAEDQMKYLEHVLVSLLKRSTKRRSPRLTGWRDDDVYGSRKRYEHKWRNKCPVDKG